MLCSSLGPINLQDLLASLCFFFTGYVGMLLRGT